MKAIKILLPEGSSLSAKQAINALGPLGYAVSICDPNPLCICRFSKYIKDYYRCPPVGKDPIGYLNFVIELLAKENFDVLLPVHEQAFLFSKAYKIISSYTNIAVSDFPSFAIMQSKVEFSKLLDELDLPHPMSFYIKSSEEIGGINLFPCYVKLAYGTAGNGTWKVNNILQMESLVKRLNFEGLLNGEREILVQSVVNGSLGVTQSLFDHGELFSVHHYELRSEGVGGSASAKVGVNHPKVREHIRLIGKHLKWHGPLMLDYIYDHTTQQPYYIEANPRIGETMNATFSGTNLVELLVRLSRGDLNIKHPNPQYGIRTHSLIAILIGDAAAGGGGRRRLLVEIIQAILKINIYIVIVMRI